MNTFATAATTPLEAAAPSVLVVGGDRLARDGLVVLLVRAGFEARGEAALRLAGSDAEVVIVDARLPGPSAAEVAGLVARHAAVLTLAATRDPRAALEALLAGCSGYLLDDAAPEAIVGAVRSLAEGHVVIDPRVAGALVAEVRKGSPSGERRLDPSGPPLSDREREVLALLASGLPNAQIGHRLYMSPSTVKKHVSRVLYKLGVENRVQAAAWAIRNGMATGDGLLAA